jgi:hypothetical protein
MRGVREKWPVLAEFIYSKSLSEEDVNADIVLRLCSCSCYLYNNVKSHTCNIEQGTQMKADNCYQHLLE